MKGPLTKTDKQIKQRNKRSANTKNHKKIINLTTNQRNTNLKK